MGIFGLKYQHKELLIMIEISSILAFGWPAASWSIKDEEYETLEWNDSNTSKKPTLKQIESKRKECEISVLWAEVRARRNVLLQESDFTQLVDVVESMQDSLIDEWMEYRRSLRDITDDYADPAYVVWPNKPKRN